MREKIKWLTNLYNPELPEAREDIICESGQTQAQAWQNQVEWLKGKLIGKPKATTLYTVEELEAQNLVGIYKIPPNSSWEWFRLNEPPKS